MAVHKIDMIGINNCMEQYKHTTPTTTNRLIPNIDQETETNSDGQFTHGTK